MKKFIHGWKLMMIVLLSSSVLFVQAQKESFNDQAPKKPATSEELLKLLDDSGISSKEVEKIAEEDYLLESGKYLNELKIQDIQEPGITISTSYVSKVYNPDATVTVTLGNGTSTNTTTGPPSPYGTYYKNFRQQYLILASELLPIGLGAGDITELGFEVAALNTCVDMPDFTIAIKETTVTALTTTFDNTGYTTVFTLPTFLPVEGWNMHVFDTPFTWDGTSNLIIDICTSLIPGDYTQNASVYYTPTTGTNTSARYQNDTQPACNTTSSAVVSENRANMMITGEELLNPPPLMPYNEIPINGSVDSEVDGDLTWTFGNNSDNYDLWFGPEGNMVKVVDNQPAGATGMYPFSGISYATSYNWQVVAMNANGTTNGPIWSFTTLCGAISEFPWTENFDSNEFPPFCWEKYSGLLVDPVVLEASTAGWILDDWINIAGDDKAARLNIWSTTTNYWLMTPEIDLGTGGYQLEFDLTLNQYATSNPPNLTGTDDRFAVLISTDGGTTWSTSDAVMLWDNAGSALVYNDINPAGETIIFDMTGYTGTVKIAFYGESTVANADNDLMINNLKVRIPPTCPDPTALSVSGISGTTAMLEWVSNSGLSDIEFGLDGFTPTGVPTHVGVTSPYEMTGLESSTAYSFYVRDDCGSGDYSEWIGPVSFVTACATFSAPFEEHFQDAVIPICWTMSGPQDWLFTAAWPDYGAAGLEDHTGTNGSFAGVDGSGTVSLTDIELLSPLIDVSPLTVPQLRFYLLNNNIDNDDWQTLRVDLWDGASWNNSIYYWGPTDNDSTWVEVMLVLSAYNITGDIQIRFVVDKGPGLPYYDDLVIDDIYIEEAPTCPAPASLGATFIAATSADLTWTSFSGLSDIEFGPGGFTPTGVPTYTGVVSPFTVTGLTAITDYAFYIRDDCGGGDYSLWVGPYNFTTQPSCPQPFDLSATNLTMTTADLTWESFSGMSDVEFGTSGFTPTGIPTYVGVTSPYFIDGLNSAAPYDFYVRDDCGSGDYSAWAGPYTLLTLPGSQVLPVFEDFEDGFTYFNNAAGNNLDWTISNTYYQSGVQCTHNTADINSTNILHETGVLDLSGASIVWLDFWQIAKTEGDYDHCYVEISTDGGASYEVLPEDSYTGTGIYEPPLYINPEGPCFDEDSYTLWGTGSEDPENTWWQNETFDLSNYLTTNVRIRFRVQTDGSVVKYGWLVDEILIYEPAYGTLEGIVTNAANSAPIEDAMITVGSMSTTSGTDGTYSLPGILVGNWTANCTKPGFNSVSVPVIIVEDQTTVIDFDLTAPDFVVDPLSVSVTMEPNQLLNDSINLSNPGLGSVDWSAGVVAIGDGGSDEMFDLQFSWPVSVGGGEAGIETDGNFVYTTKWNGTVFYKYGMDGTFIEEFSCGAAGAVRDLAYDGTYFYGSASTATVYQMDFDSQTLVSAINAPANIRAIAYNEDEELFYGNNWSEPIQIFDMTGASQGSFDVGPYGANYYGLAYDNYCDGTYLWGYAQVGITPDDQNWLVQIELPTGIETGVTFNVADVVTPVTGLAGGLCISKDVVPGLWTIIGNMQNEFLWGLELCEAGADWLTIEPNSGMLDAGADEEMMLYFDATDLLPGVYEAEIHFSTNPNVSSPVVSVSMSVEGLIPPINLETSYSCTDVMLNWEMPAGGSPDSWNVYKDDVLLDNTTTMTYSDPMVMTQQELGYYVKAVYAGEESMPTSTAYITVPDPADLEPYGLVGTANVPTLNHITLEWNAPEPCLEPDGYNIYREGVMVNTALVTDLSYVDGPLTSGLYQYVITAVYYFGESAFSDPAYALIPVGIEEMDNEMFSIFPNPATEQLTVESSIEIVGIKIFGNSGQLVFDKKVNVLNYQIDVSQFDKGIYFIRLETDEASIVRKVTIK